MTPIEKNAELRRTEEKLQKLNDGLDEIRATIERLENE